MIKKHWTVYKAFDKSIHFREDKIELVEFYNFKNNTNYKYISEFVQTLFENRVPVLEISKHLETTKTAVYVLLGKINVRVGDPCNNQKFFVFYEEDLIDIRAKKRTQRERVLLFMGVVLAQ